jgi:Tol biopolymer transport system component
MKKLLARGIGVLLMLACGAWVLAAQQKPVSADVLLGQALHQEQNEGRLEDAIVTYRKVLVAADATREQKARAQFRIGACYERLGLGEARKAYEAVVANYADQADLVNQAKARLARLGGGGTTTASTGPLIRQVWPDSGGAIWNRISPDGRFVSGADRVTGDLIIRELASGNTRRLTNIPKDRWLLEWAYFPVWSRDGRYLAYGWYTTKDATATPRSQFAEDLRVADLRDGTTRVVYADARSFPWPLDWSPDGRSILVGLTTSGGKPTSRLVWISASDGAERPLAPSSDSEFEYEAFVSPNGAYVVYRTVSDWYGSDTTFVIPSKGGTGKPLLPPSYKNARPVGWAPDGEHIVFATEADEVMAVRVVEGQAIGDPFLLRQLAGFTRLGMSRSGALLYSIVPRMMFDVYRAEIRPDFTLVGQPSKISLPSFRLNSSPSWSPDGRRLVYVSGGVTSRMPRLTRVLSIWSADRGVTKSFVLSIDISPTTLLTWSADGQFVFVICFDEERSGLYRVSTDTGEIEAILAVDSGVFPKRDFSKTYGSLVGWSPDASIVYKGINYRSENGQPGPVSIVEHRVADHAERELFRSGKPAELGRRFVVSPDGKWLVFGVNESVPPKRTLLVMPSEGGATRTVMAFDAEGGGAMNVAWSPDGRSLLYFDDGRRYGRPPVPEEWLQVDIATGAVKKITLPIETVRQIALSPNGREIALLVRSRQKDEGVWLMENFLPKPKAPTPPAKTRR